MSERKFKVALSEDELKAVIQHHMCKTDFNTETSSRIHDLTKRLNKDEKPEIETQDVETSKEGW